MLLLASTGDCSLLTTPIFLAVIVRIYWNGHWLTRAWPVGSLLAFTFWRSTPLSPRPLYRGPHQYLAFPPFNLPTPYGSSLILVRPPKCIHIFAYAPPSIPSVTHTPRTRSLFPPSDGCRLPLFWYRPLVSSMPSRFCPHCQLVF